MEKNIKMTMILDVNKRYESYAEKFLEAVEAAKKICISSHVSVDGDNLGSITALYNFLKDMGKDVTLLKSDIIPNQYNFLPGLSEIVSPEDFSGTCDLYFSMDCADLDRLGDNRDTFLNAKTRVVIDHHMTNEGYGNINFIEPEISSTCELLSEILFRTNKTISNDVATSLFTGLSTDTGRFLYTNVKAQTFNVAERLLSLGADMNMINLNIYQSKPIRKLRILEIWLEKMTEALDGALTYTVITREDMERAGAFIYDLDEIINFIRDTEGVLVSFIVKEVEDDVYKVSLRSKGNLDVSKVATGFGGGGHKNASGLTYNGKLEELIKSLTEAIKNEL